MKDWRDILTYMENGKVCEVIRQLRQSLCVGNFNHSRQIEENLSTFSAVSAYLTPEISNFYRKREIVYYIMAYMRRILREAIFTDRRRCWSDLALNAANAAFSDSGIFSASADQLIALIALRDIFSARSTARTDHTATRHTAALSDYRERSGEKVAVETFDGNAVMPK